MHATYGTAIVADADYGSAVSQEDAQSQAASFMKTYLKDPLSAQYDWKPVKRAWIHMQPTDFKPRIYGYALEGIINSKNSYGGYVGFTSFRFFYRDGKLLQVAEAESNEWSSGGVLWWQVYPPPP